MARAARAAINEDHDEDGEDVDPEGDGGQNDEEGHGGMRMSPGKRQVKRRKISVMPGEWLGWMKCVMRMTRTSPGN